MAKAATVKKNGSPDAAATVREAMAAMDAMGPTTGEVKPMTPPPNRKLGPEIVDAGPIQFHIQYRDNMHDQGVSVRVMGKVDGEEKQLLRFDCFDWDPHYHYDPDHKNEKHIMDKTTVGNPLGWTMSQLRHNLAAMLKQAGADEIARSINIAETNKKLNEVESIAREMSIRRRTVVTHNRGDVVIEAGNIRFGLEYRNVSIGQGMAIHVLGDVAGQEVELLAFDCFNVEAHYHYGPRNKNIRLYWDRTIHPDPLRWTLDQFKTGKLPEMIRRAGYPGIVAELDTELIKSKLPEIEATALAITKQKTLA
jgi:hypothetical protein